jgi:hypothetical protein
LQKKIPLQACQTSQYVMPRGDIVLGKWRSTFAGSYDVKMNVQSACALNINQNRTCVNFTQIDFYRRTQGQGCLSYMHHML